MIVDYVFNMQFNNEIFSFVAGPFIQVRYNVEVTTVTIPCNTYHKRYVHLLGTLEMSVKLACLSGQKMLGHTKNAPRLLHG